MSLFPGYSTQDNQPSTSDGVKKEDSVDDNAFDSYRIAKAAKEQEQKKQRDKIKARLEEKKDRAAVRKYNLGDTSDEDECTMIVDRSESDDDDTRRIYAAQKKKREEEDALERRKRKNREVMVEHRKRRRSSDRKRDRSSSSDSDHSRRRKKNKKDKERDRYIEPEKPRYSSKSPNWHYLATVGVTVDNPNSYMMDERKPDSLLKAMEKTHTKEASNYDQRFSVVLGANFKMNKLFFPAKTASRSNRVFDKPITFGKDPEWMFLSFPFKEGETIPLATVRCDKQIEKTEEPTPTLLAERLQRKEDNERLAIESDPVLKLKRKEEMLAVRMNERKKLNEQLRTNIKSEDLWMELLHIEDEINKLENRDMSNAVSSDERREMILDKALKNLPTSARLIIEMMKVKRKMNKPLDEMNNEWKRILHRMPNSLALWDYRVSEMIHDSKQFNWKDWSEVVKQATADLKAILVGTMRSHHAEPGTDAFLIKLLVKRQRMSMEMGFIERAISTAQCILESNIFSPTTNHPNECLPFNKIWEDNLPLVGEPNGRGWSQYKVGHSIPPSPQWMVEIKEASEAYIKELADLGRAAEKENQMVIFARHEKLHEKYNWRPVRAEVGSSEEDLERQVEINDLPFEFYSPVMHLTLAVDVVRELGGLFYGKMLDGASWEDPISVRLFSFGLLNPSLHSVPVGLPQFIDRLLNQMAMDDDKKQWRQTINMTAARIRTHAWFICQRDSSDPSTILKELGETATSAVRAYAIRQGTETHTMTGLTLALCIYEAINMFLIQSEEMDQRSVDKFIKSTVKYVISRALAWSNNKPLDQIDTAVNKSIVLVFATLLVKLPGSWADRVHRVQCVILGKDAKTGELTLPQQMEAHAIVEKVRKIGPGTAAHGSIHNWLSRFFGDDFVLASTIECLFTLATAAKMEHGYPVEKMKEIFNDVHLMASLDHYRDFYCYYVLTIRYGKTDFKRRLSKALDVEQHKLLDCTLLAREYIKTQQKAMWEVGMLANLKKKADDQPSIFNSLARLYAHRKQFTRVVASAEMQSDLAIANRVIKVYIDEAKRHKDPVLWRYALRMAAECKNQKLGEEVFTQAFADCSWSRDLHLDYIESFPMEGKGQLLTMSEKNIRMRGDPDHVQTYIDLARKEDLARAQDGGN